MKTTKLLLVSFVVVCVSTTAAIASEQPERSSAVDQAYPQAQAEVLETFMAIAENGMLRFLR